jgi:hypothetical protein
VIGAAELAVLERIQRKVLWLSTWMVHHANVVRLSADGTKVGGHQASSSSVVGRQAYPSRRKNPGVVDLSTGSAARHALAGRDAQPSTAKAHEAAPGTAAAPGLSMPGVCSPPTYQRRQPEGSVLYRTLEAHLDTFLAGTSEGEGGGLPSFVTRELRAYLRGGRLEHGVVHVQCERCQEEMVVAFSCKGRGVYPSLRRAADE